RMRLNGLAGNLVEGNEAPGRAIVDLTQKHRAHGWVVGARDLVPDLAVRVAKARIRAKVPRVHKRKDRSVEDECLRRIGCARRRFGPVETGPRVGAIAKW